ncbi:MAG TPA: hypothetical protein VM093_01570 [Aeromicrobium sp.]|nr:hypothetical protein [Aeromicrobium sp.]
MLDKEATPLAQALTSDDPAVGLEAVWALRQLIDRAERRHVDAARELGWSWQAIAQALRVSKQSVHEKHFTRRTVTGRNP